MSKLAELHKFVYDTMKVNVDGYLGLGEFKEKRLKTTVLVTHLLTDRLEDLNVPDDKDLNKFTANITSTVEGVKYGSKDVQSYTDTVKAIDEIEKQVTELTKLKEQLQSDKKAHLAVLSGKAMKVVETAHKKNQLDKLKRSVESGSQGSDSSTPREKESVSAGSAGGGGGGILSYLSNSIVGSKRKNDD